jgi:hypothetical protein
MTLQCNLRYKGIGSSVLEVLDSESLFFFSCVYIDKSRNSSVSFDQSYLMVLELASVAALAVCRCLYFPLSAGK